MGKGTIGVGTIDSLYCVHQSFGVGTIDSLYCVNQSFGIGTQISLWLCLDGLVRLHPVGVAYIYINKRQKQLFL